MTKVYALVSYDIIEKPGLFAALRKAVGVIQIEQSIQQSYDGVFAMWFYWDIEIKEGERRQVDITGSKEGNNYIFEITKW